MRVNFYGWYIQVLESEYNEKTKYWQKKYIIRIGEYFLNIDENDYPRVTLKNYEATIFTEPSKVLQKLADLTVKGNSYIGTIQNCPRCQQKVQTTCCACGCGNCIVCGYRFSCREDQHLCVGFTNIQLDFTPSKDYTKIVNGLYTVQKEKEVEGIS